MRITVVITWMSRYHVCMPINWIWASSVWWVHRFFMKVRSSAKRSKSGLSSWWGATIVAAIVVEADEEDVPTRAGDGSVDEAPCIPPLLFPFSSSTPPSLPGPLLLLLCCPDPRSTGPSKPSTSDGALDDRRSSAPTEPWNCCSLAQPRHHFPPVSEVVISWSLYFGVLYIRLNYLVVPVKVLQLLKDTKTDQEDKYAFVRRLNPQSKCCTIHLLWWWGNF